MAWNLAVDDDVADEQSLEKKLEQKRAFAS